MVNFRQLLFIPIIVTIALAGCSSLPVSEDVQRITRQILSEDRFDFGHAETLEDKKLQAYLNRLVVVVSEFYKIPTPFVVVSDTIEAQGMMRYDNDTIYLTKGMLYAIKNEAELVALLGHEVGHKYLKHDHREHKSLRTAKNVLEAVTDIDVSDVFFDEFEELNVSQFQIGLESEADYFGAMTAQRLGYNPYEFPHLLERLSQQADANIFKKLSYLKGSHLTLAQRASRLRDELVKNNIQSQGWIRATEYLENVRQIADVKDSKKALSAQTKLQSLTQTLETRQAQNRPLSVAEFLSYMNEIRALARDLNLISQLKSYEANDHFMMELVRVPKPWWQLNNKSWDQLQKALGLMARMGVGAIPVVGDAVDLYEVLTGKDFYSGQDLTFGEQVASALGVLAGTGAQWRTVSDALSHLPKSTIAAVDPKAVSEVSKVAREAIEEAPIFKKTTQDDIEVAKESAPKYRLIKDKENHETLTKLAKEMEGKKIPESWGVFPTKEKIEKGIHQGLDLPHPENPKVRLRVMPGDKNSKHANSREPYVRQVVGDMSVDKNGNLVKHRTDAAHIPLKDYQFTEFWKKHVKE